MELLKLYYSKKMCLSIFIIQGFASELSETTEDAAIKIMQNASYELARLIPCK